MESEFENTLKKRKKRKLRVRASLSKSLHRIVVVRSRRHIGANLVEPYCGKTLFGVFSLNKEYSSVKGNLELAKMIGMKLAKLAKDRGIQKVTFDRGPFKFHGRVASVAAGAREGGLSF